MRLTAKFNRPLLFATFLWLGSGSLRVHACQYCEMASDPSLQVVLPAQDAASTVTGAPSTDAPLPLTVPPATKVATSINDLPAGNPRTTRLPARRPSLPLINTSLSMTAKRAPAPPPSTHLADVGLLGVAVAGSVFCWRTRRTKTLR